MAFQAVVFSLGGEEYGIPIEEVQEITGLTAIHPIPKAPAYVKGLISIRGQAIPLINMHERFGLKAEKEPAYAIIIDINSSLVGLAVEDVKEVKTFENIAPPPPLLKSSFIGGLVNLPDRIIIQIHPDRILEQEEIINLEKIIDTQS